jgi:hypothetical protein
MGDGKKAAAEDEEASINAALARQYRHVKPVEIGKFVSRMSATVDNLLDDSTMTVGLHRRIKRLREQIDEFDRIASNYK